MVAALHLVPVFAALAETLADLRQTQHRLHKARAARHAAGQLRQYRPPPGPRGRFGEHAGCPADRADTRSTDRRGWHR